MKKTNLTSDQKKALEEEQEKCSDKFDELKEKYNEFINRAKDGEDVDKGDYAGDSAPDYSIHEVKYAYITFKTMRAKEIVEKIYAKNTTFFRRYCACCLKKEDQQKLKDLEILGTMPEMSDADTPGNIIWRNLGVSGKERRCRYAISWLFAIFLLLISLIGTIIIMSRMSEVTSQFKL